MEVINQSAALLSSYEVYELLQKTQSSMKGKRSNNGKGQNLATITYETMEYLSRTPCALQSPEVIKKFMEKITPYKLTKAEKLQLLNLRPSTAVELQLIVEEIEERLSEDAVTELLEVIHILLPDVETDKHES